jgi:hypothetical protein
MGREWLDLTADISGQWLQGQPQQIVQSQAVALGDATIRIHEIARSGAVVLSPRERALTSYGDAAVALRIAFANTPSTRSLSAPLHVPVELEHVARLELSVTLVVGTLGVPAVSYRAIVNAHCLFERCATDCQVVSGSKGTIQLNQSFNETRAVDVTVLGTHNRVVEMLAVKGLNLQQPASATIGARIYDSVTQAVLASADAVVQGGNPDTAVIVPITATLVAGHNYRVGFCVESSPAGQANANLFVPTATPYVEATGMLRINSAHSVVGDVFPATINAFIPQMMIRSRSA